MPRSGRTHRTGGRTKINGEARGVARRPAPPRYPTSAQSETSLNRPARTRSDGPGRAACGANRAGAWSARGTLSPTRPVVRRGEARIAGGRRTDARSAGPRRTTHRVTRRRVSRREDATATTRFARTRTGGPGRGVGGTDRDERWSPRGREPLTRPVVRGGVDAREDEGRTRGHAAARNGSGHASSRVPGRGRDRLEERSSQQASGPFAGSRGRAALAGG